MIEMLCGEGADVLRAGAAAGADGSFAPDAFRYESYVQAIMGEVFSLGFGPFRWVCASGRADDLRATDRLAAHTIRRLLASPTSASSLSIPPEMLTLAVSHDIISTRTGHTVCKVCTSTRR